MAMTQDTSSFKKVVVLIGLTLLVGGAEISSAATIIQDKKFGALITTSTETVPYIQFDPSLGTLTDVELVMTSQIVVPIGSLIAAFASAFPIILDGITTQVTTNFNVSDNNVFNGQFIGVGSFLATFDYFANCAGSCGGDGWSGNLKITYTYDPPPSQVPLPAALPLFATGLGALGLLAWRRKRKAAA
jgi:hypothetical protein